MSQTMKVTFRLSSLFCVAVCALALSACGSTKVYTSDKTMTYNGTMYNLTRVEQLGTRTDVALPTGVAVNNTPLDKDTIKDLLKAHDTLSVTTLFLLDEREMVYTRQDIDSYSDYSKQIKQFEKAQKRIANFMSEPKSTQLNLK
jgi:hypothetical protein|tara:strand:+ start:153 stop:584 length:432 start_codon:yes stop_codon:yes gene_type:complete